GRHGANRHRAAVVPDRRRLHAVSQAALLGGEGGRVAGVVVHGAFRDRLHRPGRGTLEMPWRRNLVLWSGLDLIGTLLCNRSEGVVFLAVGAGDPAWDATPPTPDKGRTQLDAEVYRARLVPGETLSYDETTGRLHAHVSLGPGQATGALRELGLF